MNQKTCCAYWHNRENLDWAVQEVCNCPCHSPKPENVEDVLNRIDPDDIKLAVLDVEPENEWSDEELDIAVANLLFSNLSIEQMKKLPKWLLENTENNKPKLKAYITANYISRTTLKEGLEGLAVAIDQRGRRFIELEDFNRKFNL